MEIAGIEISEAHLIFRSFLPQSAWHTFASPFGQKWKCVIDANWGGPALSHAHRHRGYGQMAFPMLKSEEIEKAQPRGNFIQMANM